MTAQNTCVQSDKNVVGQASHPAHADQLFFSTMAIVSSVTIIAGFTHYYLRVFSFAPPLPLFIHIHATVFTCWLVLFVAQTLLVARNHINLHRKLGIAGVLLAALMVVIGVTTAILAAKQGYRGLPGQEVRDPQTFLIVPLRDISLFALFAGVGLCLRRRPQLHKRMMLLAVTGGLMPAGVARLPVLDHIPPLVGLTLLLFLLASPVYDFVRHRRIYPSYLVGALISILLFAPITEHLALRPIWVRFANWLIR